MKNILLTPLLLAAFLPFASSCSDPLSNDNEPDATSGASIPSGEGDGQGVGNGNNGKMLVVFFGTHGGSGVSTVTHMLKQYYPDATFLATKGMAGTDARKYSAKGEIESWLKQIKIIV